MKVVADSLLYRASRSAWLWLGRAARGSLCGQFSLGVVQVVSRVAGDSFVLGTKRIVSIPFSREGLPVSALAIGRPYAWLRRRLGGSGLGRMTQAGESQLRTSQFAGGLWARVAGSAICALGCGRLVLILTRGATTVDNTGVALAAPGLRLIAPVGLLLGGALLLSSGMRFLPALHGSLAGRGLSVVTGGWPAALPSVGTPQQGQAGRTWRSMLIGGASLLAAVAGAAAGLTRGPGVVLPVVLVLALLVLGLLLVRPEALLLAVAAFPWLDWVARRSLGGLGGAWDDALLLGAIALLLWCVLVLRRWRLWTVPIMLPVLVAFAAAIGSVVVNKVPGDVGLYALRILFEPLLFYFVAFLFPKDRRWLRAVVFVFVLAGAAMALHGLYQYLTGAPMPAHWVDVSETNIGTRAYSIVDNPNGLGAFLLMGAIVSMSMALGRGSRPLARLFWAGACVVHLVGIAVTFSRGAWIGLAAGVIVLLLVAYRRYLLALVTAAVVGWFAAPATFVQRLRFAFSSAYITKSSEAGRLYVWRMALRFINDHPWFGLGLGTFGGTSAVTFGYSRLWVDSFYLQLGAEGGLLLLGFFLWILLRVAKGLVKGRTVTRDPYLRALTAGVLGAFVAVCVANATASVWETLTVGVGFWFLTGLATSAALHEGEKPGQIPEAPAAKAPAADEPAPEAARGAGARLSHSSPGSMEA